MMSLANAMRSVRREPGREVVANVVARVVALVALGVATILVARTGGAAGVGAYALLRVLPGLFGVLAACGLPSATAFYLAGPRRHEPGMMQAIVVLMLGGGVVGTLVWLAATPMLHRVFFSSISIPAVALAGFTVFTQLPVAVGKGVLQGLEDMRGTNVVIGLEELVFLPAYAVLWAFGAREVGLIIWALLVADVAVSGYAWLRIARRSGKFVIRRVRLPLIAEIANFGIRGQVGGIVGLLNLRLDFAVLGAIAGPATLGVYAVASKYAELLRLPGLAITWVMYPRIARQGQEQVAKSVRGLVPRAILWNVLAGVLLAVAAGRLLPALYGAEFGSAVALTWILLGGLVLQGAAGLATAYLYGTGRPGMNSLALGFGLALTVLLDFLLIPAHGAMGAAVASTVAYLTADLFLIAMLLRSSKPARSQAGAVVLASGDA
ncbi:MAG TPA: polysaccharide biosynthesis C-terminal domain-containing protein [Candidatus Nanopelagicales bacterium]|jgi:O-antigen/teichoic acid export membrane protein